MTDTKTGIAKYALREGFVLSITDSDARNDFERNDFSQSSHFVGVLDGSVDACCSRVCTQLGIPDDSRS